MKFTANPRFASRDCPVRWRIAVAVAVLLGGWMQPARAASQYATGSFTWDNGSTAKWGPITGPYNTVWTSGNDAFFQSTAGTVSIAASGATAHNLTFSTTGYILQNNTLTLTGSTPTFSAGTNITATIHSAIDGSAGLAKAGTGTLVLDGSNTYTGTLAVNAGKLSVNSLADSGTGSNGTGAISLGSGTNVIGELIYTGSGASLNRQINLAGGTGGGKITNNGPGDLDFTNTTLFSAVATGAKTLTLQGTGGGTLAGTIDNGSGNVSVTKLGAGTWTLTGSNGYTGATSVNDGTLQIGNGGLTGSLDTGSSISIGTNGTLAFNRSDTLTQGTDFNSTISGAGGVTQQGGGTTILTGTNTYEGTTAINAGTLLVNGANNGLGEVNVNSGGILGGGGSIAGNVTTVSGGTLAPGVGGIGTLSFGQNLTLSGTATFEINPNLALGLNADLASVAGDVSYDGILNVVAINSIFSDFTNGMEFKLFEAGGALSGVFATLTLPTLASGLSWQDNLATTGSLTVIPEPRAALLATLGLLALLRRRRTH